jgi:hypothetical protein
MRARMFFSLPLGKESNSGIEEVSRVGCWFLCSAKRMG